MAVVQSTGNKLEKDFFDLRVVKCDAAWKKDFWFPEMEHCLAILNSDEFLKKDKQSSIKKYNTQ